MTAIRRDGNEPPFSRWIRANPELDSIKERLAVSDCDYWIHQYRSHTDAIGERAIDSIMLVELKTFSADVGFAQRDTLAIVGGLMHKAFRDEKTNRLKTQRVLVGYEERRVRMYGVFLLRLSGTSPDDSLEMYWNHMRVDVAALTSVLKFDLDPRTLHVRQDRRHHTPSARQRHPQLDLH